MKGHGAKFGRKKEDAIAALMTSKSVEDAARTIEVNVNTLFRWMRIPEFQTAYLEARRQAVQQAVARLQQASGAAGITILKLMTDLSAPPAVRLRAAECVFGLSLKSVELDDVQVRLAAKEQIASERTRKP